ncbi:hypothetical protein BJV78DRAFT_1151357 [Lactifluus subvellereus]|nr:hypothetical protein BJV78DRAFT_1151357 [Lactifluus subvellereus]
MPFEEDWRRARKSFVEGGVEANIIHEALNPSREKDSAYRFSRREGRGYCLPTVQEACLPRSVESGLRQQTHYQQEGDYLFKLSSASASAPTAQHWHSASHVWPSPRTNGITLGLWRRVSGTPQPDEAELLRLASRLPLPVWIKPCKDSHLPVVSPPPRGALDTNAPLHRSQDSLQQLRPWLGDSAASSRSLALVTEPVGGSAPVLDVLYGISGVA